MSRNKTKTEYEVGYGKPPAQTRFTKGRSGNPGGRPRGITPGRATALALKELYRPVTVREGNQVLRLPAIQAVLRSQVALAASGNGPAQRALFETAYAIEKALAVQMAADDAVRVKTPTSDMEAARRIAAALMKVAPSNSA
jgi:Family of unknown function (DUF5681)